MRLSHKLSKVLSGDAFASARRHVKQLTLGRTPLRLDAARVARSIDAQRFQQAYQRYGLERPVRPWQKYRGLERGRDTNLQREGGS